LSTELFLTFDVHMTKMQYSCCVQNLKQMKNRLFRFILSEFLLLNIPFRRNVSMVSSTVQPTEDNPPSSKWFC